jgi:hypothetical protein
VIRLNRNVWLTDHPDMLCHRLRGRLKVLPCTFPRASHRVPCLTGAHWPIRSCLQQRSDDLLRFKGWTGTDPRQDPLDYRQAASASRRTFHQRGRDNPDNKTGNRADHGNNLLMTSRCDCLTDDRPPQHPDQRDRPHQQRKVQFPMSGQLKLYPLTGLGTYWIDSLDDFITRRRRFAAIGFMIATFANTATGCLHPCIQAVNSKYNSGPGHRLFTTVINPEEDGRGRIP